MCRQSPRGRHLQKLLHAVRAVNYHERSGCQRTDFNPDEAHGRFPQVWIGGQQRLFLLLFPFLVAPFEIGVRFTSRGNCSVGHFSDNAVPFESLQTKQWKMQIYGGKTVGVGLRMGKECGRRGCPYRPRSHCTIFTDSVLSVASSGLQLCSS